MLLYMNRAHLSVGELREQMHQKQTKHIVRQRRRFRHEQKLQPRLAIVDLQTRSGGARQQTEIAGQTVCTIPAVFR